MTRREERLAHAAKIAATAGPGWFNVFTEAHPGRGMAYEAAGPEEAVALFRADYGVAPDVAVRAKRRQPVVYDILITRQSKDPRAPECGNQPFPGHHVYIRYDGSELNPHARLLFSGMGRREAAIVELPAPEAAGRETYFFTTVASDWQPSRTCPLGQMALSPCQRSIRAAVAALRADWGDIRVVDNTWKFPDLNGPPQQEGVA